MDDKLFLGSSASSCLHSETNAWTYTENERNDCIHNFLFFLFLYTVPNSGAPSLPQVTRWTNHGDQRKTPSELWSQIVIWLEAVMCAKTPREWNVVLSVSAQIACLKQILLHSLGFAGRRWTAKGRTGLFLIFRCSALSYPFLCQQGSQGLTSEEPRNIGTYWTMSAISV